MNAWWQGLAARERALAIGGLVAVLVVGLYLFAWSPLKARERELASTTERLRADLVWMQQAAEQVRRVGGGQRQVPTGALIPRVVQTTRDAGLEPRIERVDPQGDDRVRIQLKAVAFDELTRWLGRLRDDQGLVTESATLEPVASGRVDARLVLKAQTP